MEATDGEDVLRKVKDAQPALVLLDIAMPRLDGYSVLCRLRENPRTAGLPVIALTAGSVSHLQPHQVILTVLDWGLTRSRTS